MITDFPTYKRTLSSMERSMWDKNLRLGWACSITVDPKDYDPRKATEFDESFNHKSYDKHGIPRVVDQPVDFVI